MFTIPDQLQNPIGGIGAGGGWFHDGFARNWDISKWRNNYKDVDGGVPYPAGDAYNYTKFSRFWMTQMEDENIRTEGSFVAKANVDFGIIQGCEKISRAKRQPVPPGHRKIPTGHSI